MRLLTFLSVLPAACALLLAAGCTVRLGSLTGFSDADCFAEEDERFDLAGGGVDCVAITTHNGRIEVGTGPDLDDTIRVTAHKRAGAESLGDARDALRALSIRRERRGATLELSAVWGDRREEDWQAKVDFLVTVPARMAAHLKSHNGDLAVTGLRGAIDLETHNGDIDMRSACGRILAESHNGTIECCADGQPVTLSTHNGDLSFATRATCVSGSLESRNGDIEVDLPEGARGTIEGRGHLDSNAFAGPVSILEEVHGRDFRIVLGDANAARLRVETRNGRIRLR
jgi:hypothetical protein